MTLYSLRDIAKRHGVDVDWNDNGTIILSMNGKQIVLKTDNKESHMMAIDNSIYVENLVYESVQGYDELLLNIDKSYMYLGEYINHNGSIYIYHNNKANDTYDMFVNIIKNLE